MQDGKREAGAQFWTSLGRARAVVDSAWRRTPAPTVMWPNGGRGQGCVLSLEGGRVHSRCARAGGRKLAASGRPHLCAKGSHSEA